MRQPIERGLRGYADDRHGCAVSGCHSRMDEHLADEPAPCVSCCTAAAPGQLSDCAVRCSGCSLIAFRLRAGSSEVGLRAGLVLCQGGTVGGIAGTLCLVGAQAVFDLDDEGALLMAKLLRATRGRVQAYHAGAAARNLARALRHFDGTI